MIYSRSELMAEIRPRQSAIALETVKAENRYPSEGLITRRIRRAGGLNSVIFIFAYQVNNLCYHPHYYHTL